MPLGQVFPELLVLLLWVIQKLVDGLVIDVFSFRAYSLSDFLLESSGDLLGGPAQLQLLKYKVPNWLTTRQFGLVLVR